MHTRWHSGAAPSLHRRRLPVLFQKTPSWLIALLYVVWTILPSACDQEHARALRHGSAELDHGHIQMDTLAGKVLYQDGVLGLPTDIAIYRGYVVVLDIGSDSAIHVFNGQDGRLVAQFGRRGRGPGEFATPWTIAIKLDDPETLWVYDIELSRLTGVDLESSIANGRLVSHRMILLRGTGTPTGPLWAGHNRLVSLGLFTDARIGVFDSTGVQSGSFGSVPAITENARPGIAQHVYQATLVKHPTRPLIVAATRHASQLELYHAAGGELAVRSGPLEVAPKYRVGSRDGHTSMRANPGLRFGYVDATASALHIVALFSGRTLEGYPASANFGRFLHLFDWRGRFLHAYRLDQALLTVAVSQGPGLVYGVRHDPNPAVISYQLPFL